MNAKKTVDYKIRVNRAIDYVLKHLDKPLKLELVAEAAGFSPFHFHRIFRSMVGESLNDFIKRVRLERSVLLMSRGEWKTKQKQSLTNIAFACGFTSSSDFSRCFKQRYGIAPSQFDIKSFQDQNRDSLQSSIPDPDKRYLLDRLEPGTNPDGFEVTLRDLPARTVAYTRVPNPYRPHAVSGAAAQMIKWAEQHDLADGQWLGYMWDNPDVVAHENCRYDVGLEVPDSFETNAVGWFEFPAMQVAEVEVRGPIDLEMRAIDWLFGTWLPNSGFVPTNQPSFEAWIGRPFENGLEHFELFVQIPIKRG